MLQEWVQWTRKARHPENKRRGEQLLRYSLALNCRNVTQYFSFSSVYVIFTSGTLTEDTIFGPLFRQLQYPTMAFFVGSITSRWSGKEPVDRTRESGGIEPTFFSPVPLSYNVKRCYAKHQLSRRVQKGKKTYLLRHFFCNLQLSLPS